nr:hypothetical protein [Gemmatimonadota bacterium]
MPRRGGVRTELGRRGWKTGFSISGENRESDPLNTDEERFVQMVAVTGDHGTQPCPVRRWWR